MERFASLVESDSVKKRMRRASSKYARSSPKLRQFFCGNIKDAASSKVSRERGAEGTEDSNLSEKSVTELAWHEIRKIQNATFKI